MTSELSDAGEEPIEISAVPDFVGSWIEVAFTVAVPVAGTVAGAV